VGKAGFHSVNYQNDRDGDGLSTGVWFYVLDLKKDNIDLQKHTIRFRSSPRKKCGMEGLSLSVKSDARASVL
jgi:hypothetical protein